MTTASEEVLVFVGPVVHSTDLENFNILDDAVLVVKDGKVVALDVTSNLDSVKKTYDVGEQQIKKIKKGEFLMPGLVDTHIHAPQFPNVGLGYDKTLLEWLDTYTFPLETKYQDEKFAKHVYEAVVKRTLYSGTTTACYFATVHEESSLLLAELTSRLGQRSLVGKVNMNVNHPKNYGESTEKSLSSTEKFIQDVRAINNPIVQPIITPRFAITCDTELMNKLGDMAKKYDVHIQTHISENKGEIEAVLSMFPKNKNYADVYDKSNLLTNKTVLAHGVYLEDAELQVLSSRGTSVAHCPNSNISLQSGLCDVRRLIENGVVVGLGTDCSGGYSHSVMDAMRQALSVSICISFNKQNYKPLNYQDVFYLATLGGAKALALDKNIGNFKVGKDFDALLVNMDAGSSELLSEDYTTAELVQKFVYLADDRNISQVYVAGKSVKH